MTNRYFGMNPNSSVGWILMLPDSDDLPAGFCERLVVKAVTGDGSSELLFPECGIRPGPAQVFGAAMPEASVDENCHC
jgi:hypothetical protein